MKIRLDMNLSPAWLDVLRRDGWQCEHWSAVGDPCDGDDAVMRWADEQRSRLRLLPMTS
jgi:predicted nuclease of predicted toxin-antitoxin system